MIMRTNAVAIIALAATFLMGCQTVQTPHSDGLPVAMWIPMELADQQGHVFQAQARGLVAGVLSDSGLHPTMVNGGVFIPDDEEAQAREILLTDPRLVGTGVVVLLAIPAGTGRKTSDGFDVPIVGPRSAVRPPATAPSN